MWGFSLQLRSSSSSSLPLVLTSIENEEGEADDAKFGSYSMPSPCRRGVEVTIPYFKIASGPREPVEFLTIHAQWRLPVPHPHRII